MTHEKYAEKISLWLDNELSPDEVNELNTHLAECPACAQFYRATQHVDRFMRKASMVMAQPSPGFSSRFEARLAQQQVKQGRLWLGLTVLTLSTVAMIVAGGAFVWLVVSGWGTAWLLPSFYYYLGQLGTMVNDARAFINLGGLFLKASVMTMQEPMFWGFIAITLAMAITWVRVMQILYRRIPMATAIFA
jgi:predicted anti-sigma-YlaC factor YlaD